MMKSWPMHSALLICAVALGSMSAAVAYQRNSTEADAACISDGKPFRQPTNGSTPAGWIQIGTPKKYLLVIFDTGSDKLVAKTWETVSKELSQIDQGVSGMVLPSDLLYDHDKSSSYTRKYWKKNGKDVPEQSAITYGSGTAITDVGTETATVGKRCLTNYTIMEITADSLQLLHTSKGIAGVLGLQHMKNESLGHSLFSRLRDAGLMSSFGYCRGTGNNGTFIWGDDSDEGQELEVVGQMHWALKLGNISVNGKEPPSDSSKDKGSLIAKRVKVHISDRGRISEALTRESPDDENVHSSSSSYADWDDAGRLKKAAQAVTDDIESDIKDATGDSVEQKDAATILQETCPDGKCCGILDTGSNIIAGPSAAMTAITKMVDVKPDCSNFDKLPTIELTFGGMPVKIQPSGYVMKVPMPKFPLGGDFKGKTLVNESGMDDEDDMQADTADGAMNVVIGHNLVRSHQREARASLAEDHTAKMRAALNRKWKFVFERLNRDYGVDLRDTLDAMLKKPNATVKSDFMCMPALVPLDKETSYGPLFVVGTPLLDSYYARWSYGKKDVSPKVHLKALTEAKVCGGEEQAQKAPPAKDDKAEKKPEKHDDMTVLAGRHRQRGPTERLPEEISYPHWAKSLMHV